jgi:hypothetical protein
VGAERPQRLRRRVLVEDHHLVDAGQAAQDGHLVVHRVQWTPPSLQPADRFVAVDQHHQVIAQAPRLLEEAHVAGVEDVEAPAGRHHDPAGPADGGGPGDGAGGGVPGTGERDDGSAGTAAPVERPSRPPAPRALSPLAT